MTTYIQYAVVVVNIDPTVGSEIKKKRPCVILSPNEINRHLATIVICPITSQSKNYPTRVSFDLEGETNWIVIDQLRTIVKSRVTKTIGNLEDATIQQVKAIMKETFVD